MKINSPLDLEATWNTYFGEDYPLSEKIFSYSNREYILVDKRRGITKSYKFNESDQENGYLTKERFEQELARKLTWEYFADTLPSLYELENAGVDIHVVWTLIWVAKKNP